MSVVSEYEFSCNVSKGAKAFKWKQKDYFSSFNPEVGRVPTGYNWTSVTELQKNKERLNKTLLFLNSVDTR